MRSAARDEEGGGGGTHRERDLDMNALLRDESGYGGDFGPPSTSGKRARGRGGEALAEWLVRLDVSRGIERR